MSEEEGQKAVFKDEKTQKELNSPLKDDSGLSSDDRNFMELILGLVKDGKIDLYKPASIINQDVYKGLSEETQGRVDLEAVNLLATIRDLQGLHDAGFGESFQIQNLVERLKATKERLEDEGGDLFVI